MARSYVGTGEAARALGVGATTLRRWADSGQVTPVFRTPAGGHYRWDIDDLRAQLRALPPAVLTDSGAPEPQPVVAAIVTSARGALITRRHDGRPPIGFVTGEIEPGESPADAAVRETKEETGLQVRPGRILGRRVHPMTGRTMIYMTAEPTHGTEVFVGDSAELSEVRWASLAEIDQLMPGMFPPVRAYLARRLAA